MPFFAFYKVVYAQWVSQNFGFNAQMVVVYLALEIFLFMEVDSIDFQLKIFLTKVTFFLNEWDPNLLEL